MSGELLQLGLVVAGVLQLGLSILNLALPRGMKWSVELDRLPLLIKQVFYVHVLFISVTCATFAVMTLRFAAPMAAGEIPACRWLAGCIAAFWGIRTLVQVAYYSSSHWRGQPLRTLVHIFCLVIYASFATVYALAAVQGA